MARIPDDPYTRGQRKKFLGADAGPGGHNDDWFGARDYGDIFDMIDNNLPQGLSPRPGGMNNMKYQLERDSTGFDDYEDPNTPPYDDPNFEGGSINDEEDEDRQYGQSRPYSQYATNRMRPPLQDTMTDAGGLEEYGPTEIDPYTPYEDRSAERTFPAQRPNDDDMDYGPGILTAPGMGYEEAHDIQSPGPATMLAQLRNGKNADPRIDAIENIIRQGGAQGPGMKTEQDYQKQFNASPDFAKKRTLGDMMGMPDDGRGSQNDRDEAAASAQMSDEDILAEMHKQMAPPDKGPFTGDYDQDLIILNKAFRTPGVDANALEEIFNELHGDEGTMNDRDPPTNEDDLRRGRP